MRSYKKNIEFFYLLLTISKKLNFSEFCRLCQQKFLIKQIKEVDRKGCEMIIIYLFIIVTGR